MPFGLCNVPATFEWMMERVLASIPRRYYRRFVQDFATIASPLHRLTEAGWLYVWDNACTTAFARLQAEERAHESPMVAALQTTEADQTIGEAEGWLLLTASQLEQQQRADETLALTEPLALPLPPLGGFSGLTGGAGPLDT
ncbi:unnamed protein product [Merluccius merluccius]